MSPESHHDDEAKRITETIHSRLVELIRSDYTIQYALQQAGPGGSTAIMSATCQIAAEVVVQRFTPAFGPVYCESTRGLWAELCDLCETFEDRFNNGVNGS